MELDFYEDAIIDAFLEGNLSVEQNNLIEQKLAQDLDYARHIQLHQALKRSIQLSCIQHNMSNWEIPEKEEETDALEVTLAKAIQLKATKRNINTIYNELENVGFFEEKKIEQQATSQVLALEKSGTKKFRMIIQWMGLAASVALLIGAFYVFSPRSSMEGKDLFATHFEMPQQDIKANIDLLLEGTGFVTNREDLEVLKKGVEAYEQEKYKAAAALFRTAIDRKTNAYDLDEVRYLLALSEMASNQNKRAISLLSGFQTKVNFSKKEQVHWYLALAYLKEGEYSKSKKYLKLLKTSEVYQAVAQELLQQEILNKSTSIIRSQDLNQLKPSFGLNDITTLSIGLDKETGIISLWNEGRQMPENIILVELNIDFFEEENYSGSLSLKGGDPFPLEEKLPDEVILITLVELKDEKTGEVAAWKRVDHQWLGEEQEENNM